MAKTRTYLDIGTDVMGTAIHIRHLTGEVSIPNHGSYVLNIPCGAGKSTAIKDLISKQHDKGVVVFVATKKDADDMKADLDRLDIPTMKGQVIVIHQDSVSLKAFMDDPKSFTQKKVLIVPNVNLYIGLLPALFAYSLRGEVDIEKYIGDLKSLMCSDEVREYIIIDEQPSFIRPYATFCRNEMLGYMSDVKKSGGTHKASCRSIDDMSFIYDEFIKKSANRFYKIDSILNGFRVKETLQHIRSSYSDMLDSKSSYYAIYHYLKDIPCQKMKSYLLIWDATAAILSNYNKTPFKLLSNVGGMYCSPIQFEKFPMNVERWLFNGKASDQDLREQLKDIVDELEKQINIVSPLLIITWKYMVSHDSDPDKTDKRIDMIRVLEEMLDERGLTDKFTIIYRGSGEDKATNSFADYAGVSFLGEWRTGKEALKLLNKNYGFKSTEMKLRLAAMVQSVCRIRIRRHDGDKIHIF